MNSLRVVIYPRGVNHFGLCFLPASEGCTFVDVHSPFLLNVQIGSSASGEGSRPHHASHPKVGDKGAPGVTPWPHSVKRHVGWGSNLANDRSSLSLTGEGGWEVSARWWGYCSPFFRTGRLGVPGEGCRLRVRILRGFGGASGTAESPSLRRESSALELFVWGGQIG